MRELVTEVAVNIAKGECKDWKQQCFCLVGKGELGQEEGQIFSEAKKRKHYRNHMLEYFYTVTDFCGSCAKPMAMCGPFFRCSKRHIL